MKLLLMFVLMMPMVFAYVTQEEMDTKMSLSEIVAELKNHNLSPDCVKACEQYIHNLWVVLCDAACKILLQGTTKI